MKKIPKQAQLLRKTFKFSLSLSLILCVLSSPILASVSIAQKLRESRLNLKVIKGRSIKDVIRDIETKAGVRFVYNPDALPSKVALKETVFKNEPLLSALDKLGFSATEQGDYVVLGLAVNAQVEKEITGNVHDASGVPLPGVSVKVQGGKKATLTDARGNFRLKVSDNAILSFSMVGFQALQSNVQGNSTLNITLRESQNLLQDVVIVGYGTQSKATLTGAVSNVSLDKLESRSLNNVGDVLAGKTPGVIVTNEGGDPTSAPRVNIRGMGGLNSESVLYVVDGSIVNGSPQINPNDIESISVLKDASAAIYGARASGGVVLITTKKGKKGQTQISFDAKLGQQSAWKKLKPLNAEQRAFVAAEAAKNGGSALLPAFNPALYPDGQITRTNWMDEVFRTGMLQDYNTAVNGGNDKSTYFLSFNYRKAEGIVLNTQSERYNFRVNSEHRLNDWLTVGEQLSYSTTNARGANTSSDYTGALLNAIYYPTNGTPYNPDGSFAGLPGGQYAGDYGDIINPVAELLRMDVNNPVNTMIINPYAKLNLAKGLTFRSNLSITKRNAFYKNFTPKRPEVGKPVLTNTLVENTDFTTDLLAEQVLNYKFNLNAHQFDITGGYAFQKTRNNGNSASGSGFDDEAKQYRYLNNATVLQQPTSYFNAQSLSSLFLRANYNYRDKYMLSLIGRRDGTSLLKADNRNRNYYSVSAGWSVGKEDFLSNVQWLDELKVRGSYGVLGNLAGLSGTAVSPLLAVTQSYFGQTPTLQNGYIQTILANPNMLWAESKQTNIGLDFGVFKRLSLTADYFIKDIDKMIITRALPGTAGLGSQTVNAGLSRDNGIELGLNFTSKPGSAFNYSVNATFTKVNNKLKEYLPGINNDPVSTNFRNELKPFMNAVGQPIYSYYVLKTQGIFQSQEEVNNYRNAAGALIQPNAKPGDFRFADLDGSGDISPNDRYYAGNAYPSFSYGLSFNADYKNFDLNIFAQGVQGNKLFNAVKRTTYSASGPSYNKLEGILDAWSPTNTGGSVPIISSSDANGNFNASDFYIEDGSFLRLRNVTLGYTLPGTISKRVKAKSLRFYVSANNLFTITDYSGFDPEVGMDNHGMDVGRYPQARSFFFGASLKL